MWDKLPLYGFKEIIPYIVYNMWGSGIIDEDDREDYNEYLSKEVLDKIIEHNLRVAKQLSIALSERDDI